MKLIKIFFIKIVFVVDFMSKDFFNKGYISNEFPKFFVLFIFILFWLAYLVAMLLHFSNYEQIAIDLLMSLSFIGLLYFLAKKHGRWTLIYSLLSFLIISYSEITSVWVLHTYEYLNWPSGILWTYPTTIGIGWVYLCYTSYLLTNILVLNRENKFGFKEGDHYLTGRPIYLQILLIMLLSFIDGLILFQFGVLNETVGIGLGLWKYNSSNEPKFFGAPTKTLFTYFAAGFIFNLTFRLIEYVMNNYKNNKTLSFKKIDIYPVYLFFLYWFFLIFESVRRFGINYWSVFVSGPIILLVIVFVISKFYYTNKNAEIT